MRSPLIHLVLACVLAAVFCPAAHATVFLKAGFDDKPVDAAIGTGGAEAGEPVSVSSYVTATVRGGAMPTPCLEIQDNSATTAGSARFEFLGSQEITTGSVVISMNLWFPDYEQYFIYIREQGGASKTFLNLRFTGAGDVQCSDANGDNGVIGTYETGRHYRVWIFFAMDSGVYSVYLDGSPAIITEDHGIGDRGVGAVLLGCSYDGNLDGSFYVDDLDVTDYYPQVNYLRANFNYKTIDAPIGENGPEFGEPSHVSPVLVTAIVRDEPTPTPSLELHDTDTYAAGGARFDFLYDAEVTSGTLIIAADLWFDQIDQYWVYVREHASAAYAFTDLFFTDTGYLYAYDSTHHPFWAAPYEAGRTIRLMIIHNLNTGTYDLWYDGSLVVDDQPHNIVGRGIGSVMFNIGDDPDLDGTFYVDNVWAATSTPPQTAVCCQDIACDLLIPMDCAFNGGELHSGLHACTPNPCDISDVAGFPSDGLWEPLSVYPNPSSRGTRLAYRLEMPGDMRLDVVDAAGRRVRALLSGRREAGEGSVVWDGADDAGRTVSPGVYFVRLSANGATAVGRMVLLE